LACASELGAPRQLLRRSRGHRVVYAPHRVHQWTPRVTCIWCVVCIAPSPFLPPGVPPQAELLRSFNPTLLRTSLLHCVHSQPPSLRSLMVCPPWLGVIAGFLGFEVLPVLSCGRRLRDHAAANAMRLSISRNSFRLSAISALSPFRRDLPSSFAHESASAFPCHLLESSPSSTAPLLLWDFTLTASISVPWSFCARLMSLQRSALIFLHDVHFSGTPCTAASITALQSPT
jgi:hypothetical protein